MIRERDVPSRYLAFSAAALMVVAILSLAACGSSNTKTTTVTTTTTASPTASAKDTFCNDLKGFSASLTNLQGLDPKTATRADVTSAANDLKNSGKQVVSSAKALGHADVSAVQTSLNSLQKAVKSLPKGNTIQQDLTQLQSALQATAQSFKTIFDKQGCKTASS